MKTFFNSHGNRCWPKADSRKPTALRSLHPMTRWPDSSVIQFLRYCHPVRVVLNDKTVRLGAGHVAMLHTVRAVRRIGWEEESGDRAIGWSKGVSRFI